MRRISWKKGKPYIVKRPDANNLSLSSTIGIIANVLHVCVVRTMGKKSSSSGGDSGRKKYGRGYVGSCFGAWRECDFSHREDVFTFHLLYKEILWMFVVLLQLGNKSNAKEFGDFFQRHWPMVCITAWIERKWSIYSTLMYDKSDLTSLLMYKARHYSLRFLVFL